MIGEDRVDVSRLRGGDIDEDWLLRDHAGRFEATPSNIEAARAIAFEGWKERARTLKLAEPQDLSNACKFCALFTKLLFGGSIDGNYDHVFNRVDGQLIDLSADSADVRAMADPYRSDPDFLELEDFHYSLGTTIDRIRGWVDGFVPPSPSPRP